MRWSELDSNPTNRTLRQFAVLWTLFFGAFAMLHGLAGNIPVAWGLAVATLIGGGVGLIRPQALRPIYVSWMIAAFPVGWLVSHLLLTLIYYGVFTPLGLLLRLTGRDLLRLRAQRARLTYWNPKPTPRGVRSYFDLY